MSDYTAHAGWFEPAGGIRFRVTDPVKWEIGIEGSGMSVIVPIGFVFDVSIPKAFRWLFDPKDHRFLKAAALHDWLLGRDWSRLTAGAVFHNALAADGVILWRRLVMWLAVSLWKFQ